MKRVVLIFGTISGVIIAVLMSISVPLSSRIGYGHSLVVGYTIMVAAFLLVFFGVRSYRDNYSGGRITFGKALAVGCSIMLITCCFYVATWEVMYFEFMPDFMDKYGAYEIARAKADGATPEALQKKEQDVDKVKQLYKNPLYNVALTLIEPLPVGLLMAFLSAGLLRRKDPPATGEAAAG